MPLRKLIKRQTVLHFLAGRITVLPVRRISQKTKYWRHWRISMPTTLESLVSDYLRSSSPAQHTREEYDDDQEMVAMERCRLT